MTPSVPYLLRRAAPGNAGAPDVPAEGPVPGTPEMPEPPVPVPPLPVPPPPGIDPDGDGTVPLQLPGDGGAPARVGGSRARAAAGGAP